MRNQNALFVTFCLCLTVAILSVYNIFIGYFNGHQEYEARIGNLQRQVATEKLSNSLLSYQIKDFQETVALVFPEKAKLVTDFALNNFAASVRTPASDEGVDLSGALFEKGRKFFGEKDYDKAIHEFNHLVEKYPLSRHGVEAHFFNAESYFLKKDFYGCLSEVDTMVTQYPDNDLTGFILLRMGQISEFNNQSEEANEIYQTVLKTFKNEKIQTQARQLAKSTETK